MYRFLSVILISIASVTFVSSPANASGCVTTTRSVPFKSTAHRYRHSDVWLYGDSITYQTWRNLRDIAPKHRFAVDAWWGRSTKSAVDALAVDLRRYHHRLPDTVVMAVGTNDLSNISSFKYEANYARKILPSSVRLVWVNTYVETTSAWNEEHQILTSMHRTHVVKWSDANLSSRRDGKSSLLIDGIHVNNVGCTVRNRLIRSAL